METRPSDRIILDIFQELRPHLRLGVSEYLAARKALAAGFAENSRKGLLFLCRALWAKSESEALLIGEILESKLPRHKETEDAEAVFSEKAPTAPVHPHVERPTPADAATPAPAPALLKEPGYGPHAAQESEAETSPAYPDPLEDVSRMETHSDHGSRPVTMRFLTQSGEPDSARVIKYSADFDWAGGLPLTRRQMSDAWKQQRRMLRTGPQVELDMEATLAQAYRLGIYLGPILVPLRVNQSRIVILADEGGSMVPFRKLSSSLIDSAMQAGLSQVDVLYFHDVPGYPFFRNRKMAGPLSVKSVLERIKGAGILLIGDAGAARMKLEPWRSDSTAKALEEIRPASGRWAWLNPVPQSRWAGSTAELIRRECAIPMFPLDRPGLARAMAILKGQKG